MYEVGPIPDRTFLRKVGQIQLDATFGLVKAGGCRVSPNRVVFRGIVGDNFQPCIVIWDYVKGTIQSFKLTPTSVKFIFLKASTTQMPLVLVVESELNPIFMGVSRSTTPTNSFLDSLITLWSLGRFPPARGTLPGALATYPTSKCRP